MKEGRFTIRDIKYPSGSIVYRVTGMLNGKQVRLNYKTREEALGAKQEFEIDSVNAKPTARLKKTRLSPEQLDDAEHAFREIGKGTFSLTDAVKHYNATYRAPVTAIMLSDAFNEFLDSKQKANKRQHSIRNLRTRVGFLVTNHGDKHVSDIQPDLIADIIHRQGRSLVGRSAVTCDNDRRAFSGFFNWCAKKGYCAESPMTEIEPVKFDREEPMILSVAQVRRLLDAATAFKDGILIPYVVLGLFAAIRPTELARLTWKQIDIEQGTVTIGPKLAKMRQRRIVELSENCIQSLLPHVVIQTPIKGINWRRNFNSIKKMAGIKEWPQDIMRHTGISHHLAHHEHEGKTAKWAGNSPDMVQKHYKGLVKRKEAEDFWGIRPIDASRKIISMP